MVQSNEEALYKRARSKYISKKFSIYLLQNCPDSPLRKAYTRSCYCSHELLVNDSGNLVGEYCKARWCLTCNRIRTALIILGYGPQLRKLDDLHFMTLTAQSCTKKELPGRIELFQKIWGAILNRNRNDNQRGRGRVLIGLRKCECTGRPGGRYHYHFHVVIQGYDNARWVMEEWMKRVTAVGLKISQAAQDLRPADENTLLELAKYTTKIATKATGKDGYLATAQQLDWIFQCMQGRRSYQPFGGLSGVQEDLEDDDLIGQPLPVGLEGQIWEWEGVDWISEYGELLTGFEPTEKERVMYQCESDSEYVDSG